MKMNRMIPGLAAALVAGLTLVTVQKAFAVTTVANASKTTFTVPAAGAAAPFSIASFNAPVHLMATQLNFGFRGIAQATIAYSTHNAPNEMVSWVGINSFSTSTTDASLASGWSFSGGNQVLRVSWANYVKLMSVDDTGGNPSRLQLTNSNTSPAVVVVTQIW